MKGVITAKVVNVFAIDSKPTANGGTFNKREVWLMDDMTDPRYPNYYNIQFQGQATSIPDTFYYGQVLAFDVEIKGNRYVKPGTQVENIITNIRCWRATPVQVAAPVQQAPVAQPNPYAGQPAGFYPATPQQQQSAAGFMPNQPGAVQTGGFMPPAQQVMGNPGGFQQPTGFQQPGNGAAPVGNGFNQGAAQPAENGFGPGGPGFAPMPNQASGNNNGFNTQAPTQQVNNGFQQPAAQAYDPNNVGNNTNVADELPF